MSSGLSERIQEPGVSRQGSFVLGLRGLLLVGRDSGKEVRQLHMI
jgi:hypothetical protein